MTNKNNQSLYKNLIIRQRGMAFADDVIELSEDLETNRNITE